MFDPKRSILTRPGLHRRAFTLIEVMAVGVILRGLGILIFPGMASRDDLRLGSAARSVIADVIFAQNRAISTQTTQFVSFTVANGSVKGGYALYDAQPFAAAITNPVSEKSYTETFGTGGASQFDSISVQGLSLR